MDVDCRLAAASVAIEIELLVVLEVSSIMETVMLGKAELDATAEIEDEDARVVDGL